MKLLKVFGLVVGAHLAVFTVIFATPGCRSTGKQKPKPEDTLASNAGVPVAPVDSIAPAPASMGETEASPVAPVTSGSSSSATVAPVAPVAPVAAASSDVGVRFAPTRPSAAPIAATPEPVSANGSHTVAKGDSLWSIAKKYGISVDELTAANHLAKSATLHLGQKLIVPAKAAPVSPAADSDAANTYEVKSGDTLGSIARRHGTTAASLRTANNLSGDNLRVGQKLVIPGNAASTGAAPAPAATPAASTSAPRGGSGTYTVASGDTLGSIAKKHGVKMGDLATLNAITDPAKLRVGQTLKLPAGAKASAAAAAPAKSHSTAPAAKSAPAAPAPAPAPTTAPAAAEPAAPVTPVEPPTTVEPMAVPVIRID